MPNPAGNAIVTFGGQLLPSLGTSIKKTRASVSTLGQNIQRITTQSMVGVGNRIRQTMASIQSQIAAAFTIGAVVKFYRDSEKIARTFEREMTRVFIRLGNATAEQKNQLTELARVLGATTSFSAKSAASAMVLLAAAGLTVNETVDATPGVLQLAASAGLDLATSAGIITAAMKGMGLDATSTTRIIDVFTKQANNAKVDVVDLGEGMNYTAATMHTAGQSIETTMALLGGLNDAGVNATRAGTALNAMMSDLASNVQGNSVRTRHLNVALYDQTGNFRNMIDILADFEKQTVNLTDKQKDQELRTIFQTRALVGFNSLMSVGSDRLYKFRDANMNSAGAAAAAAQMMNDDWQGAVANMDSAWEGFAEKFGATFKPMTLAFIHWRTNMYANWSEGLDTTVKRLEEWRYDVIMAFEGVGASVQVLVDGIVNAIWSIPKRLVGFAESMFRFMTGGENNVLQEKATNFFQGLRDFLPSAPGTGSKVGPLKDLPEASKAIVTTLAQQITQNAAALEESTRAAIHPVGDVIGHVQSAWHRGGEALNNTFAGVMEGIKQTAGETLGTIKNVFIFKLVPATKLVKGIVFGLGVAFIQLVGPANAIKIVMGLVQGVAVTLAAAIRGLRASSIFLRRAWIGLSNTITSLIGHIQWLLTAMAMLVEKIPFIGDRLGVTAHKLGEVAGKMHAARTATHGLTDSLKGLSPWLSVSGNGIRNLGSLMSVAFPLVTLFGGRIGMVAGLLGMLATSMSRATRYQVANMAINKTWTAAVWLATTAQKAWGFAMDLATRKISAATAATMLQAKAVAVGTAITRAATAARKWLGFATLQLIGYENKRLLVAKARLIQAKLGVLWTKLKALWELRHTTAVVAAGTATTAFTAVQQRLLATEQVRLITTKAQVVWERLKTFWTQASAVAMGTNTTVMSANLGLHAAWASTVAAATGFLVRHTGAMHAWTWSQVHAVAPMQAWVAGLWAKVAATKAGTVAVGVLGTAVKGLSIAFAANPLGVLVLALGGLVLLVVTLERKFKLFSNTFKTLGAVFRVVGEVLVLPFTILFGLLKAVGSIMGVLGRVLVAPFRLLFETLKLLLVPLRAVGRLLGFGGGGGDEATAALPSPGGDAAALAAPTPLTPVAAPAPRARARGGGKVHNVWNVTNHFTIQGEENGRSFKAQFTDAMQSWQDDVNSREALAFT